MAATRSCPSPVGRRAGTCADVIEESLPWWQNAFAERQLRLGNHAIASLFFRIHVDSMTGLLAIGESA